MNITRIATADAPAAIGPYAQGVVAGGFLYTSGQIPLDPLTGQMVAGPFAAKVECVLRNLQAVLAAAGCGFGDVVKANIFVTDLAKYAELNELYAARMGDHRPARAVVQVAGLPRGAEVEIDMIARVPGA
jgi:2-iminobutanoate/2-iminopropanoate deaminase